MNNATVTLANEQFVSLPMDPEVTENGKAGMSPSQIGLVRSSNLNRSIKTINTHWKHVLQHQSHQQSIMPSSLD